MIALTAESTKAIRDHAEQTYPEECCGLLLGASTAAGTSTGHVVYRVVRMDNVQDENRARRFLISPAQYLAAERSALAAGMELLGFYHSHPDHPAVPSEFDTQHALPWFAYVIISVRNRVSAELTAWVLREDRSQFEPRSITEEP